MKSNSSPNDIPYKFLKTASCIVSEWLSKFFNKCMITGEFPDSWKIAHITPIPKLHSPSSSFRGTNRWDSPGNPIPMDEHGDFIESFSNLHI